MNADLPTAWVDWSRGRYHARPADLLIDPTANAGETAERLAKWIGAATKKRLRPPKGAAGPTRIRTGADISAAAALAAAGTDEPDRRRGDARPSRPGRDIWRRHRSGGVRPRAEVANAREFRAKNRLGEAEAAIRRVLANDPGNLAALIELGHIKRTGRLLGRGRRLSVGRGGEPAPCRSPRRNRAASPAGRSARRGGSFARGADRGRPTCVGAFVERGHCAPPARRPERCPRPRSSGAAAIDSGECRRRPRAGAELRALGRNDEAERILRALLAAAPQARRPRSASAYLLIETNRRPKRKRS